MSLLQELTGAGTSGLQAQGILGSVANTLTATTGTLSVAAGGRAEFVGVGNTFWFAVVSA